MEGEWRWHVLSVIAVLFVSGKARTQNKPLNALQHPMLDKTWFTEQTISLMFQGVFKNSSGCCSIPWPGKAACPSDVNPSVPHPEPGEPRNDHSSRQTGP